MSTLTKEVIKHGKTKYVQGDYYSKKNDFTFPYRSSYELAYLYQLEKDDTVLQYIYEPFELYYTDSELKQRIYRPDFMILFTDGSMSINEVKPTIMLKDYDVQAKARATRMYIKENYKNMKVTYNFITEKELFNNDKEYQDFLKSIK